MVSLMRTRIVCLFVVLLVTPSPARPGAAQISDAALADPVAPTGREAGHFDAWGHTALLQTLASQAALAIANARSYQEKKSRAGHMEALVKVGQALTRTTDLSEPLQLAWEVIEGPCQADPLGVARCVRAQDLVEFPFARSPALPPSLHPPDNPASPVVRQ